MIFIENILQFLCMLKQQRSSYNSQHEPHLFSQQILSPIKNAQNFYVNDDSDITSQFKDEYETFFERETVKSREQWIEQILKNKIFYLKQHRTAEIRSSCLKTDFESLKIQLQYQNFAMQINVIDLQVQYDFSEEQVIGTGTYGIIYRLQNKNQQLVVKSIYFDHEEFSKERGLQKIYKQYFMCSFAHQLGVGPKIIPVFGYDIVIFKTTALFCMQKCSPFRIESHQQSQQCSQIKSALKILHSFNIIHGDIKPVNILWSPSLKKCVFIDYGLSFFVRQPIGMKTYTSFIGTYKYASNEMKKIFLLKSPNFIDLYYNDAFALSTAIKQQINRPFIIDKQADLTDSPSFLKSYSEFSIQQIGDEIPHQFNQFIHAESFIANILPILGIKYYISQENFQAAQTLLKNQTNMLKSVHQLLHASFFLEYNKKNNLAMIQQLREKIREQLVAKKFKTCQADQNISKYLSLMNSESRKSLLFPIDYIYQMNSRNFSQILNHEDWIQKLFCLIHPKFFMNAPNQFFKNKSRIIIEKMYSVLNNDSSTFFTIKVRKVFLFFFQEFEKSQNVSLLEHLLDLFLMIGDFASTKRVKLCLLDIYRTKYGEFIYVLKSLKFFVTSQNIDFFTTDVQNIEFLYDIFKQSHNFFQQNNKNHKQISTLKKIAKNVINFINNFKKLKINEQILAKIKQDIQIVKQKIQQPRDSKDIELINNIIQIMHSNLVLFLKNQEIQIIKQIENVKVETMHQQQQQLIHKIQAERYEFGNYCEIYDYIEITIYNMLVVAKSDQIQSISQIWQFYMQVCEGKAKYMVHNLYDVLKFHMFRNKRIAYMFIKCKYKWLAIGELKQEQYLQQVLQLLQPCCQLYLNNEIQTNLTLQQIQQISQILDDMISQYKNAVISESAKQNSQIFNIDGIQNEELDKNKRKQLQLLIRIIKCIKIIPKETPTKVMSLIRRIKIEITQLVQQIKDKYQCYSSVALLYVLVQSKKNCWFGSQSVAQINQFIIELWDCIGKQTNLINYKYVIQQIVTINCHNQNYDFAFNLIQDLISYSLSNHQESNQVNKILMVHRCINLFCILAPLPYQQYVLQKMLANSNIGDYRYENQCVYLLFQLFYNCHKWLSLTKIKRSLAITALGFQNLNILAKNIVKSAYYTLFRKNLLQKHGRKYICTIRKQAVFGLRPKIPQKLYKFLEQNKKQNRRSRIISQINYKIFMIGNNLGQNLKEIFANQKDQ